MKFFTSIAAVAAIAGSPLLHIASANAKPFIYSNTFAYSGTNEQCLKGAEAVLKNNGVEDIQIEYKQDNRIAFIYGSHRNEYTAIQIECNQKLGITALAIAGLDNDFTFQLYSKLFETTW